MTGDVEILASQALEDRCLEKQTHWVPEEQIGDHYTDNTPPQK